MQKSGFLYSSFGSWAGTDDSRRCIRGCLDQAYNASGRSVEHKFRTSGPMGEPRLVGFPL
jgi:hypothetical protein